MNVLEKILEELEERVNYRKRLVRYEKKNGTITDVVRNQGALEELVIVEKIIRSHMDDGKDTNVPSNWIPVEERLPEINTRVLATVKHSSWISDLNSEWVPENEKIYYPETQNTYIAYVDETNEWIFIDEEGSENICDKEFGIDMEKVYDVVTYWQPITEPYKGEEASE